MDQLIAKRIDFLTVEFLPLEQWLRSQGGEADLDSVPSVLVRSSGGPGLVGCKLDGCRQRRLLHRCRSRVEVPRDCPMTHSGLFEGLR